MKHRSGPASGSPLVAVDGLRPVATGEPRTGADEPGAGVELDEPAFLAAAAFVDRVVSKRYRAPAWVALRPIALLTTVRLLRRLPRLELELTGAVPGQVIAARLGTRDLGLRTHTFAQGVLTVPADPASYLKGRGRQGLRNKLSKARRLGITTVLASDRQARIADAEIYRRRLDGAAPEADPWPLPAAALTWFVAYGPDGSPLAVQCIVQDRDVALLKLLHAVPDREVSSPARHALHQAGVEHLSAAGVRYFVGDSALRASRGIREFMHGLGYLTWHLRFRQDDTVRSLPGSTVVELPRVATRA